MNLNFNIYAVIMLIIAAAVGFGGGIIAKKITEDEDKQLKLKIIIKSLALLGVIAALLISIYL